MKHLFPPREPFNAWSHYAGALLAFVFLFFLMDATAGASLADRLAYLVYGVSVILLLLSSGLYHSVKNLPVVEERLRLFDHIMIYVLIAGSYTPICAIPLEGSWKTGMLTGIWIFALAGILKKAFWLNAPRWFSTVIYLLMGWLSLLIFPQLWELLPKGFSFWIILGGIFYTLGAVIYVIEKPNPVPEIFGSHEIWHIFVMGGVFSHYWAIYYYLPALN